MLAHPFKPISIKGDIHVINPYQSSEPNKRILNYTKLRFAIINNRNTCIIYTLYILHKPSKNALSYWDDGDICGLLSY